MNNIPNLNTIYKSSSQKHGSERNCDFTRGLPNFASMPKNKGASGEGGKGGGKGGKGGKGAEGGDDQPKQTKGGTAVKVG